MKATPPQSNFAHTAIWLSCGAALLAVGAMGVDIAISGLLTLRSGYFVLGILSGLAFLAVIGTIHAVRLRLKGGRLAYREAWAAGAPGIALAFVLAALAVLSQLVG